MAGPDECPWERHWDDESSSYYYFNPSTESSEWDVPAGWEAHFAAIDAQEGSTTADNAAVPGADDGNAGDEDGKEDYPVTGESTEERAAHSPAYAVGQENAGDPMEQDDDNEDKPLETTDGAVGEAERGEDSMLEETQEEGEASYPEQSYDIGGDDQGADQDGDQAEQGGDQDEAMDEEGREAGEEDVSRRSHDSSAEDGAVEDGALEDGAAEGDGVQEYGDEAENDEVVAEAAVDDYYIATGGSTSPALDGASTCAWIQTEDDTGNVFYYNELTEESSWDAPPEFTAYQATLQQEQEEGQQEVDEDNTSPYAAADGEGDDRDSGFVDEESPPLSMSPPPPLPQIYYPAGTPSPPSSPEEDNEGEEELTPAEGEEELTPADVAASASSTSSSSKASPRPGDTPEAAGGGQRAGMPIIGAHAARSTRRYAKSPSPDLATGGTGVAGGGGMSFPSFGEDSSPKYDWHGEDEGSPPLMPGSAAGSSSFGGSPSPDTMNGSGVGFASGELSPILDNSGSVGVVLDGEQAVGTGPTAGGKENELARAGGGIRVSEAISREQRTESAEEDVADSERRVRNCDFPATQKKKCVFFYMAYNVFSSCVAAARVQREVFRAPPVSCVNCLALSFYGNPGRSEGTKVNAVARAFFHDAILFAATCYCMARPRSETRPGRTCERRSDTGMKTIYSRERWIQSGITSFNSASARTATLTLKHSPEPPCHLRRYFATCKYICRSLLARGKGRNHGSRLPRKSDGVPECASAITPTKRRAAQQQGAVLWSCSFQRHVLASL